MRDLKAKTRLLIISYNYLNIKTSPLTLNNIIMRIPMFIEEVRVPKAISCEIMEKDRLTRRNPKKTSYSKKLTKFQNTKRKAL